MHQCWKLIHSITEYFLKTEHLHKQYSDAFYESKEKSRFDTNPKITLAYISNIEKFRYIN